jgi:hypothetical protein
MTVRREDLPEYLRRAFDDDDAARADYEQWDYELQKKLKQRSAGSEPQRQHTVDWDRWFIQKFDAHYRGKVWPTLRDGIAEYVSTYVRKQLAERKLPPLRTYVSGKSYSEGTVLTFAGSLHQALRDTSRPPGSEDWVCVVSAGERGIDGVGAEKAIDQIVSLCREVERLQQQLAELKTDAEVQRVAKVIDLPQFVQKRGNGHG